MVTALVIFRMLWWLSEVAVDADSDGVGNNGDTDDDNDGVLDEIDNCRAVVNDNQVDTDSDGVGDMCDTDDDADGVIDSLDGTPIQILVCTPYGTAAYGGRLSGMASRQGLIFGTFQTGMKVNGANNNAFDLVV